MDRLITIKKPFITIENEKAYLKAKVTISCDTVLNYLKTTRSLKRTSWLTDTDYPPAYWEDDGCLWFSVDAKYADYLCDTRSNAFVLAMFWYAMVSGSDICFEAPLSQKLYDALSKKLIPVLAQKGISPIRLSGPLTSQPVNCTGGCATGMSCGVDSFYTLHQHKAELTHLTFYSGSSILPFVKRPYNIEKVFQDRDDTLSEYIVHAETIAQHHNLPLIAVNTNLDRNYYRGGYIFSAMYRHSACSLALEHLFSVYISSSSGHRDHNMKVNPFAPTQLYEDLLCECLQTESFRYITSDHDLRTFKIKKIADDKDFQKFAEVCFNQQAHHKNCGDCIGCWKTMIPLDILGKLDQFHTAFDLETYYKNRRKIFSSLIRFSFTQTGSTAKDITSQLLAMEETDSSESGRLFREIYEKETASMPFK